MMEDQDWTILGEEILAPEDFDSLRRYFREIREGIERIYEGTSDDVRQRHYRLLSDEIVERGVERIKLELKGDEQRFLETMLPDIERISWQVFREEFDLNDRDH